MDINLSEARSARLNPKVSADRVTDWLVGLILIASTIVYRFELGLFSVSVLEPLMLAATAGIWWLHRQRIGGVRNIRAILADPPIRFVAGVFAMLGGWLVLQGLWIDSKTQWLSDIRDWGVPLLTYTVMLIYLRRGWQRWTLLIIAIACAQSALGVFQMLTNSFRPFAAEISFYKTAFIVDSVTKKPVVVSFGLGLFGHPNALGMYALTALLLGAAWLWLPGRWQLKAAALLLLALGLASAYSKSNVALAGMVGGVMLAERFVRGNRRFGAATAGWIVLCIVSTFLAIKLLPNLWLATFDWRVRLWRTAAGILQANPTIGLFGAGMDDYRRLATYGQPNNVFVYLTLNYGVLSIIGLSAIVWRINREAWVLRARGVLERQPLLGALWLGLWAYVVTGLVETPVLDIYGRAFGLLLVTCFLGLRRETLEEPADAA